MPRLFVGVPGPAKHGLSDVREEFSGDANVNPVDPELYHVTVAFVGDAPESQIDPIVDAIEEGADGIDRHEGAIEGLGAFPNPRNASVLWADIEDTRLTPLANATRQALDDRGIDFDDRHDFTPHVTIARFHDRENAQGLVDAYEGQRFAPFPVEMVHVYESTLKPEGPEYEVRGTVELE
jgi:2'-5' RNA ligase